MKEPSTQQPGPEKYVRFETNLPQDVALKFATGLDAPAQKQGYQDQIVFTLVDGRRMYLPIFAADLIAREGIQPGEEFRIGKFEVREGQKKCVRWRIERLEAEPPPQDTPLEASLRRSAEIARSSKGAPNWDQHRAPVHPPAARQAGAVAPVRSVPAQPRNAEPVRAVTGPPRSDPQRPASSSRPTPATAAPMPYAGNSSKATGLPPTKVQFEEAFEAFLVSAGRATKRAEQRLGSEGGSVRFDSRDVAAIATTMFIAAKDSSWLTWGGVPK